MRMQQTCVDLIRSAKGGDVRTVSGYAVPQAPQSNEMEDDSLPPALELFPLYTLALMKNVAFRGGTDVHPDERSQAFFNINQMWLDKSKSFIYPPLFSLHDMQPNAGYASEENDDDAQEGSFAGRDRIVLPSALPLTIDSLSSDGIYLVDNGIELYLWVGREVNANYVNALFGIHSLENVEPVLNLESGDEFSKRVGSIISALRDDEAVSSKITVVKEGDPHMEARFFWFMVEDRASFQGGTFSYEDFMNFVQNPNAGPGAPAPPGRPSGQMQGRGPMAPQRRGPGGPPQPPGRQQMQGPPPPAAYGQPPAPIMSGRGPPAPPQQQQYGQGPPQPGPPQPAYGQSPAPPMAGGGPPAPPHRQQYGQAPPGPPQAAYEQQGPPAPPQYGQGPPSAPYSGGGPPKPSVPAPPGRAVQHNGIRRAPPPPPRGRGPPPPPPPPPR